MIADHNSHSDRDTPACRKCRQAIDPQKDDDVLDKFGDFVRLRCTSPDCGHVDWYKTLAFTQAPDTGQRLTEGPGEVWIHDVILGLSFRAEGNSTQ